VSVESDIRDYSERLNRLLAEHGDEIEEYNAMVHAARTNSEIPAEELGGVLTSLYHRYNTTVFIGRDAVKLIDELGKILDIRSKLIRDHNKSVPRDHELLTDPNETFGWLEMIQDETYDVSSKFSLHDKERARAFLKQLDDLEKQREGKL